MSQERVETVRRLYEQFAATRELPAPFFAPDFVWDMSTFQGWLERPEYEGFEGTMEFLRDWVGIWDEWGAGLEELRDADDRVVAIACQYGRAEETGVPLEMRYGQVWTFRGEQLIRAETYLDPGAALKAAGL